MQYSRFFALFQQIKQMGYYQDRGDLISDFTFNRTASLKDLSDGELHLICNRMQRMVTNRSDNMRKKIISMFKSQGYTKPDGSADMSHIYASVRKHGYLKKSLNDYSYKELPRLVYQFEQMKIKEIKNEASS